MLTCCLKLIFSFGVFLDKLDKKDKGKTKAALPTKIRPISIELTATDVPGLGRTDNVSIVNKSILYYYFTIQ